MTGRGNFIFEQGRCAIICPPLNHLAGHETCCRTWYCHLIAGLARLRLRRASQQVAGKEFGLSAFKFKRS
jgi:hypothetical protein